MKILGHSKSKVASLISVTIMLAAVTTAAQRPTDKCRPASVIPLANEPPAKLIVDLPLPEPLASRRVVIINYCADNLHFVPVFGPNALAVSPRVGHVHVRLDDASWVWADASGNPIILMGLSPGPHKVLIELEDANHHPLDQSTVKFVVPEKVATETSQPGDAAEINRNTGQPPGTKRTDLQRHDLSAVGREVVQVRVDFDPGYSSPRHTHPGEEIIYVLEGTLEYEIDGKRVTAKPGDVLFVPAGTIHSAKNIGVGNGAELATYTVEKGKPLITLVK